MLSINVNTTGWSVGGRSCVAKLLLNFISEREMLCCWVLFHIIKYQASSANVPHSELNIFYMYKSGLSHHSRPGIILFYADAQAATTTICSTINHLYNAMQCLADMNISLRCIFKIKSQSHTLFFQCNGITRGHSYSETWKQQPCTGVT